MSKPLELLTKADRIVIATREAAVMPDAKNLGVVQAIARMNEQMAEILAEMRTELGGARPKATKKNPFGTVKGGLE